MDAWQYMTCKTGILAELFVIRGKYIVIQFTRESRLGFNRTRNNLDFGF